MRSGADSIEPCDAAGFAPKIIRWSVRSTSGIGAFHMWPNSSALTRFSGHWSTVPGE